MTERTRKLTDADVKDIISRFSYGESATALAQEYGVSRAYLYHLRAQEDKRATRKIKLRSGGELFFSARVHDYFSLSSTDRAFLEDILARIQHYEERGDR